MPLFPSVPSWPVIGVNFLPLTVNGEDQLEDLDVDGDLVEVDINPLAPEFPFKF